MAFVDFAYYKGFKNKNMVIQEQIFKSQITDFRYR